MLRFLLFFIFATTSQFSQSFEYTLKITEQELQTKIAEAMPIEKKQFFVTIRLSDPKVDLIKQSNRIGIFINIDATAPGGIAGKGRANITGTLRYDAERGAFHFVQPKIVHIEIDNLDERYAPKVKSMAQYAITKALINKPVYTLKDDKAQHQLAKSVLKSIAVKDENLVLTLGIF